MRSRPPLLPLWCSVFWSSFPVVFSPGASGSGQLCRSPLSGVGCGSAATGCAASTYIQGRRHFACKPHPGGPLVHGRRRATHVAGGRGGAPPRCLVFACPLCPPLPPRCSVFYLASSSPRRQKKQVLDTIHKNAPLLSNLNMAPLLSPLAVISCLLAARSSAGPVVSTDFGDLEGNALASGVSEWLGIPFASPPVGRLRFASPAEWTAKYAGGRRDASKFGAKCWQPVVGSPGNVTGDEVRSC